MRLPIRDKYEVTFYVVTCGRYRSSLFKFLTICVFDPPFRGSGEAYNVHPMLIGKRAVNFKLVLIELFFRWVLRLRC